MRERKQRVRMRRRDRATEACVICGVPAGTKCRSTETWETFARGSHRVPEPATVDPEELSVADDEQEFLESQGLKEV